MERNEMTRLSSCLNMNQIERDNSRKALRYHKYSVFLNLHGGKLLRWLLKSPNNILKGLYFFLNHPGREGLVGKWGNVISRNLPLLCPLHNY